MYGVHANVFFFLALSTEIYSLLSKKPMMGNDSFQAIGEGQKIALSNNPTPAARGPNACCKT